MKIIRGKIQKPLRMLVYGVEGVGKTTFAAGAPNPVFLGAEDGSNQLDVARYDMGAPTFAGVLRAIHDLSVEAHEFQTLVIDSLDWLEPTVFVEVVAGDPKAKRIEDFEYGKGYIAALDQWRLLVARIDELREKRGMAVVMVGHSQMKDFKDPEGLSYQRYELKLHHKSASFLKEWCDVVGFAKPAARGVKIQGRVIGAGDETRWLHTMRTAAYDAKSRYPIPAMLPLSWQAFAEAMGANDDATALRAEISALATPLPEARREKLAARMANATPNELRVLKNQVRIAVEEIENG